MKLLIIVLIISLSGLIGYCISLNYKKRYGFFYAMNIFLQNLKVEIDFLSTKLLTLIEKNIELIHNKELAKLLNNFKYLTVEGKNMSVHGLFDGMWILTRFEQEEIFLFFKQLGKVDVKGQIDLIVNMKNVIETHLIKAKHDVEKYSSFYIKMGLLFGLFVALVII